MKRLIAFIVIFNCTTAFAQNLRGEMDSLHRVLGQAQKPADKIDIMSDLSSDYDYLGEADSARLINAQMLKIATDAHEDSLMAVAYGYIASHFGTTSDYKPALEFDLKALALAEKSKSGNYIWLVSKEIGIIYKELKNYPEALKYLKKSALFLTDATRKTTIAFNRTYSHLAEIFLGLGETDSALRYVQLVNEVTVKEKDPYGFARMLYIFASVYKAKEDTDLAESYYRKCLAFSDAENIYLPYATAATAYGQYFFDTKQYHLSKEYALKGFIKARQGQNKLGMINAAALLRKAYYAIGQKDSSYYYADIKDIYSDSVFNDQKRNQIQNISFAQQIEEKENQAKLSEEEEGRRQDIQYALLALGIIAFVTTFLLLSRSFITNTKMISFLSIVALLIVFEFLNLLLHPFLERITNHSPVFMLLTLVCIAALLVPLHHKLEQWTKHKLVEKNKTIRLAAAKKTIEQLEGDKK